MAVKTSWSSGDVLTAADLTDTFAAKLDSADYTPGLALITPTSIAYSGGSASSSAGTTTVSGSTSVSLNGIFSATYQNYLLVVTGLASGTNIECRLRASGTDNSATSYTFQELDASGTSVTAARTSSSTRWIVGILGGSSNNHMQCNISKPYEASDTGFFCTGNNDAAYARILNRAGTHAVASSFDGLTLYVSSNSITGTIRVYGYEGA